MIKVKVCIKHSVDRNSCYVESIDWEPGNQIEGTVYQEGAWWDDHEEVANLVLLESAHNYLHHGEVWVDIDKLRVKHYDRLFYPVTLKARQQGL
jgi:hypothetical protein